MIINRVCFQRSSDKEGVILNTKMKKKLSISIILLTYRDFNGVIESAESVLNQTYSDVELIVSDDGSDNFEEKFFEETKQLAGKKKKKMIVYHHKQNVGTVRNINHALDLANGDIIGFLGGGDCYASPEVLESIVELFKNEKIEVVTGLMKGISEDKLHSPIIYPKKKLRNLLKENNHQKILNKMFNDNCFCAPATFYRKEVYNKYGKYDESIRLIEDYPFLFRLVLGNAKIFFWNQIVTLYKLGGVSTSKPSQTFLSDVKKIRECILFPNIEFCQGREKRLFLYNFIRKSSPGWKSSLKAMIKYPEQFLYWQCKRVVDLVKWKH